MSVIKAAELAEQPPQVQREEAAKPKQQRTQQPKHKPASKPDQQSKEQEAATGGPVKLLGVGTIRAHEAISILSRIPRNDALRSAGFKMVKDWIRREEL